MNPRRPGLRFLPVLVLFAVTASPGVAESIWSPENFEVGAGLWGGYSWGHFQEAIYSSDPIEGLGGGGDLFVEWSPVDFQIAKLGVRGTLLETNFIPQPTFRLIQLDLNADVYAEVGIPDLVWFYAFAGATANVLNTREWDAPEDVAEYGLGFRYGGGAHVQFRLDDQRSLRVGPEFVMGHAIYTLIIYHYSRLNFVFSVLFE